MKCTQQCYIRPYFVYDNIDSMLTIREACGFSLRYVCGITLIPIPTLREYEKGIVYPGKNNYNKLADLFDWEKWL